tara:strand:- start:3609 stop:3998 length:390 start_codon:yes stop_codon:yes gene_type:complete
MNYSKALKKNEEKKIVYNNILDKYLSNGYSILRNKNSKVEIINAYNYENLKKLNEENKNNKILNKMINNWNDFREQDIEYYGSRSIYYNYEETIKNMVEEDNKINKELYDIINNLDSINSDIYSDNEDF